jgi:hypothetical protein
MKLILLFVGWGVIYLGANSLDVKDYLIMAAGVLMVHISGMRWG